MNKIVNIAIVGLGQVGIYLYNELRIKKKEIEIKTGKKINIVAISAKNKNKKRKYNINKKIFYTNPFKILKENNRTAELHIYADEGHAFDGERIIGRNVVDVLGIFFKKYL